jgi:hypothetical protein
LLSRFEDGSIIPHFPQRVAANAQPFAESSSKRERGGLHGEPSILKDDPVLGSRLGEFFYEWAAHRIEDEARAPIAGNFFNALDDILFFGGDDLVGAQFEQFFFLG